MLFPRPEAQVTFPEIRNLAHWLEMKSTKLDAFARICEHYCKRDDAPHIYEEEGVLVIPPMPAVALVSQKRRICAYLEFVQFRPLVAQVLHLTASSNPSTTLTQGIQVMEAYGLPFLWLDGQVDQAKRGEIINRFYTDGNPRILIFSRVASAGVNLAVADVLIHIVGYPF